MEDEKDQKVDEVEEEDQAGGCLDLESLEEVSEQAIHKAEKMAYFGPLTMLVDSLLALNRESVPLKIRQTHLKKLKRRDQHLDEVLKRLKDLEKYLIGEIKKLIKAHPAFWWFSQIRGIGPENIAKVIGLIDAFGRLYDVCPNGHQWAPPAKGRGKKQKSICPMCGGEPTGEQIWVRGIVRLGCISALNRYSGWGFTSDGKIDRKVAGQLSHFNSELKTMSWRVGAGLLKAGKRICPHCATVLKVKHVCPSCLAEYGPKVKECTNEECNGEKIQEVRDRTVCDKCGKRVDQDEAGNPIIPKCVGSYAQKYEQFKAFEVRKALAAGKKIIEAPGRMCNACGWEGDNPKQTKCPKCENKTVARLPRKCEKCGVVTKPKDTKNCPECKIPLPKMVEEEGTIWATHITKRAMRKMIKLFLSHLWLVWRAAEGLSVTSPYPIAVLGHKDFISPEEMIDKPAKVKKERGKKKGK
jgi:hypothetical protein